MPLFDTILKHPVKSTDAIFKFLYQHALEGSFILSFYDVPAETWAKISQLQFPLEIIVDLVDTEVESKLPESLKGVRGFSGSTILGDGRTIMILDTSGLLENSSKFIRVS